MDIAQSTILFSILGIGLFGIFLFILNIVTKNYIVMYLRAKASRGKLILTEVVSQTDNYFALGSFKDGCFEYKTRQKTKKRLSKVTKKNVESFMGVFKVKVNEAEDFAYTADGEVPQGMDLPDATAADTIINRIMIAAGLNDPKIMIILVCVIIISLLVIIDIFVGAQAITAAKSCQQLTATIR